MLCASVEFGTADPLFSMVYCPLSKYLSLDAFWQLLLAPVNISSSFKLRISFLSQKPLSSFNIVFLGPHIQPGVAARCLIPGPNDYLITLGPGRFQLAALTRPFLREANLSETQLAGFSSLMNRPNSNLTEPSSKRHSLIFNYLKVLSATLI